MSDIDTNTIDTAADATIAKVSPFKFTPLNVVMQWVKVGLIVAALHYFIHQSFTTDAMEFFLGGAFITGFFLLMCKPHLLDKVDKGKKSITEKDLSVEREKHNHELMKWALPASFISLAATIFLYFGVSHESAWFGVLVIALIASTTGTKFRSGWYSRSEYLQLSGSTFKDGSHRCISCGGRGIYRSSGYKSNYTYAKCSRCQQHLWVD